MVEYTASTFGGQMKGELIVASFNKDSPISRYKLTDDGLGVVSTEDVIAEGVVDGVEVTVAGGTGPSLLDVTATGDDGPFPGTIWIVPFAGSADVIVLEPNLNSGP